MRIFTATSQQTLLEPSAHRWIGSACLYSAMQTQFPRATTLPTYYLCPAS